MKRYAITLRHDAGTVRVIVNASDEPTACQIACDIEKAPRSAVLRVDRVREKEAQ